MHKVAELRGRIADMSAGQFRHRFSNPVLVVRQVLQGELLRPKRSARLGPGSRGPTGPRTVRRPRSSTPAPVHAGGTMMLAHPSQDVLLRPGGDATAFPSQRLSNDLFVWLAQRNRRAPRSPVTIGRTSRCDVVVNDFTVSGEHAWIVRGPGVRRYFLVDRGSTNGSRVGGEACKPKERMLLTSGDEVCIGRVSFLYLEPLDFYALIMAPASRPSRPRAR